MQSTVKIIVVDDNPVFLEGIQLFLCKNKRYEVIALFSSGESLLKNLNQHDPDLILLDIEMPGMNGIQVASVISEYIHDPRLIAITLYQERIYIDQLIAAGFRGFVNKNRVYEELDGVISGVIGGELVFPHRI